MSSPTIHPYLPVIQEFAEEEQNSPKSPKREQPKPPALRPVSKFARTISEKPDADREIGKLEDLLFAEPFAETQAATPLTEKRIFSMYSSADSEASSESQGSVDSQEKRASASESDKEKPLSVTQLFEDLKLEAREVAVKVDKRESSAHVDAAAPLAFLKDLGKSSKQKQKLKAPRSIAGFNLDF